MARTLRQRFEVLVDVATGRGRREVDLLGDEFDEAERKARRLDKATDDVGTTAKRSVGGGAVGALRDLSGPLGEASTALGDFGDSFQVVGEQAAASLGLGEKAAGRLVTALGIAGAAVGGVITVWNQLRDAQQKAVEQAREYADLLEKAKGRPTLAAREFLQENLSDAQVRALARTGLNVDDLVKALTGQGGAADTLVDALRVAGDRVRQLDLPGLTGLLKTSLGVTREEARDLAVVLKSLDDQAKTLRDGFALFEARLKVFGRSEPVEGLGGAPYPAKVEQNIRIYTARAGDPIETVDLTSRYRRNNGTPTGGAVAP